MNEVSQQSGSTSLTIALATSSFIPAMGGVEIGLHNIATQLQQKGHRPIVISSYTHVRNLRKTGWAIPYEVVAYPPRILSWLTSRPWLGASCLKWFHGFLQRRYKFDVWHATIGYPVGVSVVKFCKAHNIPHLVRCVGEDIQIKPEINYGMRLNPKIDTQVRHWLPQAQRLVAITESVVEEYRAIDVDENRIVRIPNGIDLTRFKAHKAVRDMRKELDILPDAPIFLALGRQHPKKNFAQIIEAAAVLRTKEKLPFAVIIAGRGVSELKPIVDEHGASDIVHLCEPEDIVASGGSGPLNLPGDEILDYYAAADIFVMPSLIETFGIVTIEAMAAGLPVIAADSPGSTDVIRGGKDGLIYDGSLSALVQNMAGLMKNNEDCKTYSKKSLNRAENFDWAEIVERYLEEYRVMIQECQSQNKMAGA